MTTSPTLPEQRSTATGGDDRLRLANLFWSISGEAARLVTSFIALLLLVRLFEPEEFGLLVAATGLFNALFPFAGMGGGWLVLRRVTAESQSTMGALASASGMMLIGSAVLGLLAALLQPVILPQLSLLAFLGVAVSEMLLLGLVETTLFAAQAERRLKAKAITWALYGTARAGAAAGLLVFGGESVGLGSWILTTIGVGAIVLATAQLLTVGGPVIPRRPGPGDIRDGLPYALGFGADRVLFVSDTVILAALGNATDAGLYAGARKLMTVTIAPVIAALHAVSADLWATGGQRKTNANAVTAMAIRFTGLGVVYGVAAASGWILFGDAIASVLGPEYSESADILPWLSVVPLLLALEIFAGTALTASDHHRHRVTVTLAAGVANVAANLVLIPGWGWRGAVAASLSASALHVIGLWTVLAWAARRRQPATAPTIGGGLS